MKYESLENRIEVGEVWAPGPLYNTVWVIRRGDRRPVVVHATKKVEVEYEIPKPPTDLPSVVVERARDIHRRHAHSQPHLRRYIDLNPTLSLPTQAECEAAEYVTKLERATHKTHRTYLDAHYASVPLSQKRFIDLSKEENDNWFIEKEDENDV
jgi:hypothetical protein